MKESLMLKAVKTLLQLRLMTSPPVSGIAKAEEFDCELGTEGLEEAEEAGAPPVEGSEVEAGEVAGGVEVTEGGVTVAVTELSTVTWKLPVAVLPAASVEEQMTVVGPMPNVEPVAGEQFATTDGSKLSVAEAV